MHTIQPVDEGAPPVLRHGGDSMRPTVRLAAILGLLATAAVLGVVAATAGLGVVGWIVGPVTGSAAAVLLVAARMRSDRPQLFPADWVTLTRMLLIAAVAGLVADSFDRPVSATALTVLSGVALVLDSVDGQVARRTGTATALGARFDGEADAFLILLLSITVSRDYGSWVLLIGAARYALLLAGRLMPWLAAPLPPRYWRKVVAATQGIVLAVAISGLVDRLVGMIAVAAALLLLTESFGRDVVWLYRTGAGVNTRRTVRVAATALSAGLLWGVLLAPDRATQYTPAAFIRIPVELLVLVAASLVLPTWPRRIVAAVAGFLFGLLALLKIFDLGFYEEIGRPFNPVLDRGDLSPAIGVVRDAIGPTRTNIALVLLCLAFILIVGAITASAIRIAAVAARRRRDTARGLAAVTVLWALCAGLSLQFAPGSPIASTSATGLTVSRVRDTSAALQDERTFEHALNSSDPQAAVPAANLLTGLRGKDVVIAFVESYGQVAVQGTTFSPAIDTVLRQQTASLAGAGWSTQSAWLTSPTFGGISWLAHSTLQSGLWVDSVQRYAELVDSSRFNLTDAFAKAGWRTVSDIPSDEYTWPAGSSFYHYDKLYSQSDVGYQGPKFGYASMPDQYTLSAFQRNELAPGHKPVMAEIDLVSSHEPWAPLPSMVPWNQVGDGSIFDPMPAQSETSLTVWHNSASVRQFYGESVQYSMQALTSWVTQLNDPNLVLILLGDHQPATLISGAGANHQVPISIVAHDPAVFSQMASWNWQDGLLPGAGAPLEPMDAFRNQLLGTFSTPPTQPAAPVSGP